MSAAFSGDVHMECRATLGPTGTPLNSISPRTSRRSSPTSTGRSFVSPIPKWRRRGTDSRSFRRSGFEPPTAPRHRQEDAFPSRTALPARQCPGELAHRLLMLLVPDFSKVAGNLELHTLVHCDLPPTVSPDTFVKIGDRRAQRAGDIK